MRSSVLGLTILMAACGGLVTAAGLVAQSGGNPLRHEVNIPAIAGDPRGGLAFPTAPPEADNCQTYTWTYRSGDASDPDRPFLPMNTDGGSAWITGYYIDEPVMHFDFEVPEDAEEVYVQVNVGEGLQSHQYAMRLWGYADGRWRGSLPIDPAALDSLRTARIIVCWRPGPKPVSRDTSFLGLSGGTARVGVGGGEAIAGGRVAILPSQANASQDSATYVTRITPGGIQSAPVSLNLFDQAAAPIIGIDGSLLLPPETPVLDAVAIDGGRTAFLVKAVTTGGVWNPVVTLSGFPNGASFPFPAPKAILGSEPVYFSLNIPNALLGTWSLDQVQAALSGGLPLENAPAGAAVVYGQPVVLLAGRSDFDLLLPLCNPTSNVINLNGGIEVWHFSETTTPDAGIFGSFNGRIAPFSCETATLDGASARIWNDPAFDRFGNVIARWSDGLPVTNAELALLGGWEAFGSPSIR